MAAFFLAFVFDFLLIITVKVNLNNISPFKGSGPYGPRG